MPNPAAEALKNEGNQYFKAGDFRNAIQKYGEAIAIDPSNHTYWSNRSACYAGLENWEKARDDAKECITVNKTFVKGYFRLATAQRALNELEGAKDTLVRGLAVEPRNADLKQNLKEIEDLIRGDKVASFISQAETALKSGDYGSCVRLCDQALRLDAGNPDVRKLLSVAQPKFEMQEKSRKSGLTKTELVKEAGDECYKNAQFEDAIRKYTECLDLIQDKRSPLAIKCYANRSACYKQLSDFDNTINDTTAVLEAEPNNVKALVRRAQAFEAIERYRFALQDVRAVLHMPPELAGAANIALANGMQHRLNRVIQQLKQG